MDFWPELSEGMNHAIVVLMLSALSAKISNALAVSFSIYGLCVIFLYEAGNVDISFTGVVWLVAVALAGGSELIFGKGGKK